MANKTQVIDAVAERIGDRKAAAAAVDEMIDYIIRSVDQGERVTITGFGSFEPRERAARTARNPRTGEAVQLPKTTVPAFRAGTLFRDVVSGARKLPKPDAATSRPAPRPVTPRPAAAPAPKPAAAVVEKPAKPAKKKAGKKAEAKVVQAAKPAKAPKAAKSSKAENSGKGKKNKKSGGKKKK